MDTLRWTEIWYLQLLCNLFQFETKQTLTKFEGQQSISSADFYGGGPSGRSYSNNDNYYNTGPDLQEIRDGVKQGVTKVAGKLSNLANGLVNSIQVWDAGTLKHENVLFEQPLMTLRHIPNKYII